MTPAPDPGLLRRVADRIDAAPSVACRSGGIAGVVSSYLPGERLVGIRATTDGRLDVHVVMTGDSTADQVERDVLAAVGSDWDARSVDIGIDDIDFTLPSKRQLVVGPDPDSLRPIRR